MPKKKMSNKKNVVDTHNKTFNKYKKPRKKCCAIARHVVVTDEHLVLHKISFQISTDLIVDSFRYQQDSSNIFQPLHLLEQFWPNSTKFEKKKFPRRWRGFQVFVRMCLMFSLLIL